MSHDLVGAHQESVARSLRSSYPTHLAPELGNDPLGVFDAELRQTFGRRGGFLEVSEYLAEGPQRHALGIRFPGDADEVRTRFTCVAQSTQICSRASAERAPLRCS